MKTILTTVFLMISIFGSSQDSIKYDANHQLPGHVVLKIDSVSKGQLYQKSINWIKETYSNPNEVVKTMIENEMIRFEGVKLNGISHKALGISYSYNATYTITLRFKDNKVKFEITNLTYRIPASQTSGIPVNEQTISALNVSYCYKKNGKLRSVIKNVPFQVEHLLNELKFSLESYLKKERKNIENDW